MAKESLIRKKAIEILENNGWITWFPAKVKFKQNDVFGIIDLMAIKGRMKKNIQLTTFSNTSARRKKIKKFLEDNNIEMAVEIWSWCSKKKIFKQEKITGKIKTSKIKKKPLKVSFKKNSLL